MKRSTASVIRAVINSDETATEAERKAVRMALNATRADGKSLSVAEASMITGLSRTTIWRMCVNGVIGCVRRGKKYFVDARSLPSESMV